MMTIELLSIAIHLVWGGLHIALLMLVTESDYD